MIIELKMELLYTCPICGNYMENFGEAHYRVKYGFIKTPIFYCKQCDLFRRIISKENLKEHYHVAGYVQLQHEISYLETRKNFYVCLISIIRKYRSNINTICDIGCSYGHFLEILIEYGYKVYGVEINKILLNRLIEKGLKVWKNINHIPNSFKFDCITLIDSFYYFDLPLDALYTFQKLLNPQGLLIMRLTNRNWLAKFRKKFLKKKDLNCLGDVTFSYSIKSITKILQKAGFEIKAIIFIEKGKVLPFRKKIFYLLTYLVTYLTFKKIPLSPGIIIVAKKKD